MTTVNGHDGDNDVDDDDNDVDDVDDVDDVLSSSFILGWSSNDTNVSFNRCSQPFIGNN